MTILYIIPFKNGKYFKYGVTDTEKQGFSRPHDTLHKLYDLDFVNAKMVTSTEARPVLILERQLKNDFSRYFRTDDYIGSDGYSEILPIEHFGAVIAFIETKISLMKWQSLTLGQMPMPEIATRERKKEKRQLIKPTTVRYADSFDLLDVLAHPYGEIFLRHAANENKTLCLSEQDQPGIFKFVNAARYKRFHYSLERALCSIEFIPQVNFHFREANKTYVEIFFHREFQNELKRGFFDKYIKEHVPTLIDIDLLEDVRPRSEEKVRESELEDQHDRIRLEREAEEFYNYLMSDYSV
jgi:hypothetical protein